MLSLRELEVLLEAYGRLDERHGLGEVGLVHLDVSTGMLADAGALIEAVEAFEPAEGWMIDLGADAPAKAFWADGPDGAFRRIEGRLLEGEFRSDAEASLDVRHVAGDGWRLTLAAPASGAPASLAGLRLDPVWRDVPFLVERTRLLTAFGATAGPQRPEPSHVRYAVAWQASDAPGDVGLSPRFQMFEGFARQSEAGR